MAVRQSAGDGQADILIGVSYRRCDGGGWSNGQVGVSCRRGDVGQPDRRGRMVYRRSDSDRRSDGRCA